MSRNNYLKIHHAEASLQQLINKCLLELSLNPEV